MRDFLKTKRWPIAIGAALTVALAGALAFGLAPQNLGDDVSMAVVGAGTCTHPGGASGISLAGNPGFESALAAMATLGNWTPYQELPGTPGAIAPVASARGTSGFILPPNVAAPAPHTGSWSGFASLGIGGAHNLTQHVQLLNGKGYEFSFWVWPNAVNQLMNEQAVSVVWGPIQVGTTVVKFRSSETTLSTTLWGASGGYQPSPPVAAPALLGGRWNSVKVVMTPTPGTYTPGTVSLSVNNSPLVTTTGGLSPGIGSAHLLLGSVPDGFSFSTGLSVSGNFYDDVCLTQGATNVPLTGGQR